VIAALEYLQEQQLIVLETSAMTEVFKVNNTELDTLSLVNHLYNYFAGKEKKEIKRIASLVKFFQLDTCLSFNLARYFDDSQVPEQCGHCSVCRGHVALLEYSQQSIWPNDEELIKSAQGLKRHLAGKIAQPLTFESYCRFFAGMTVPLFGRNKIRKLAGFASCEQQRYQDIRDKLFNLNIN
jgi:ATP-dependent DNA helicase RecQ